MGADSTVLRGVAGVHVVLGDVCGCGCMRVHGVGVGECAWRVVGAVGAVVGGTQKCALECCGNAKSWFVCVLKHMAFLQHTKS